MLGNGICVIFHAEMVVFSVCECMKNDGVRLLYRVSTVALFKKKNNNF